MRSASARRWSRRPMSMRPRCWPTGTACWSTSATAAGFAREIDGLLASDAQPRARCRSAPMRAAATMIWPRLAEACDGRASPPTLAAQAARLAKRRRRRSQPLAPDFAAVERMSDATGMLQHSIYSVPDRRHGYCIDDNARALMLMTQIDRHRRGAARQVDDDLRRVRPARLEPRRSAASATSWTTTAPGARIRDRRIRTAARFWALGVTARDAGEAQAPRLGADRCSTTTASAGVRTRQPARAGLRDARRRGDARGASRPRAVARRSSTRFGDALIALARRSATARLDLVRDRARL